MGKKKDVDPPIDAEDKSAARDFVMARLAAARGQLAKATTALDMLCMAMADPEDDAKGKNREMFFEDIDDALGAAAIAMSAASEAWEDVDPEEGEPDLEDDDEDDK